MKTHVDVRERALEFELGDLNSKPGLPLTTRVTLGKLLNPSEFIFSYIKEHIHKSRTNKKNVPYPLLKV